MKKNKKAMRLALGLALLVAGGLLIWWGYDESRAVVNRFARAVSGAQPDRVMWKYIGGAASALAGLVLIARR
ncbi:MAG: DUF3185 family protein [Desulfuromonadales bacterium]